MGFGGGVWVWVGVGFWARAPSLSVPSAAPHLSFPLSPSPALLRERPVSFGSALFGSAPLPSGARSAGAPRWVLVVVTRARAQGRAPRFLREPPSPATSVEPPAFLSPVLRPTFPFHSLPPPPRFLRERVLRERHGFLRVLSPLRRWSPQPLCPQCCPPPLLNISPSLSRAPPFFVPSVTTLAFTYLLSAQFGSEQRFKDNPERQTRKTQDEPQWIVAQRRLSARTIPGFS